MTRLTQRDEFGNSEIIGLSDTMPELYAELSFSETNCLTNALNKLADYEDTGMEPEDVKNREFVTYGTWYEIRRPNERGTGAYDFQCNRCHLITKNMNSIKPKYCPHCGAKMSQATEYNPCDYCMMSYFYFEATGKSITKSKCPARCKHKAVNI